MNTVPNAHGTFMAQAIQTCQVGACPAVGLGAEEVLTLLGTSSTQP